MSKECFVYLHNDTYLLARKESELPPNKLAARVSLSGQQMKALEYTSWKEYQEWLEFYFDHGQKLVTA